MIKNAKIKNIPFSPPTSHSRLCSCPARPHLPRSSPPPLALAKAASSPACMCRRRRPRQGRLLPYEPACRSGVREHEDRVAGLPSAPRSSTSSPQYHSVHSTLASLSSCSSTRSVAARNKKNAKLPPLLAEARSSSWKILLHYLWFLVSLYQKVRAVWLFSALRPGSRRQARRACPC
jgi:hypothetical protein